MQNIFKFCYSVVFLEKINLAIWIRLDNENWWFSYCVRPYTSHAEIPDGQGLLSLYSYYCRMGYKWKRTTLSFAEHKL